MVTIKKLNCGTTVIMEKSERVQSAALGIWVRAGASDDQGYEKQNGEADRGGCR